MSTDPKPTDSDADLGITFTEKQSPTPDSREGGLKMPTTPTLEEVMGDTETARQGSVFNVSQAFNAKHDLGTIVTDKKRRRTSFRDNVQSAWGEWWRRAKKTARPALETIAKPKQEAPKVSKVETRVEVVETAAANAQMAPKDDHKVVIENIKTFKRDVERITGTSFVVKEDKKAEPAWTHTIDPVKVERPTPPPPPKPTPRPSAPLDLRSAMVAPLVEKHIQKDIKDYDRKPEEKKVELPRKTTPTAQVAYMHIPGTVERKDRPQAIPAQIAPLIHIKKEESPLKSEELLPPKEVVGYVARAEMKQAAELAKRPREAPLAPDFSAAPTSQDEQEHEGDRQFHSEGEKEGSAKQPDEGANRVYLTPAAPLFTPKILIAAFSGVVLLSVVFVIVLTQGRSDDPEIIAERETPEVQPFFEVDAQSALPLSGSSAEFFDLLMNNIREGEEDFIQLYPTVESATGARLATAEEFFAFHTIKVPEKMLRALEDTFMLGGVRTSSPQPFVALRSYNFDVLFAGMLEWEPHLRSDFGPLFDASYVEEDIFTDAVIDNRPARVLKDVRGEEVLLYMIVGQNTVVITSSREALERVIEEL